MTKESALYQLMGVRMNGVMNNITNSDGEYPEVIQQSDVYSDKLERMDLPEEVRLLFDRYISEQNAHGAWTPLLFIAAYPTYRFNPPPPTASGQSL